MIVNEIKYLDDSGKLKMFLKAGVISIKIKVFYDIYNHYKKEFESNKGRSDRKMMSIENTSNALNVCDRTVYRAIKLMES